MDYRYPDRLRLLLFKNQIQEHDLETLKNVPDSELIKILDSTVLPNSQSITALKQTVLFHFLFMEKKEKKEKLIQDINKIINFTMNLTKTEKIVIKYGVVKGFKTKFWRKEFFIFLKTPLALKTDSEGRKIMSSYTFKEIFFFAYNLVKRGKNNERLPRF